MEFIIIPQLILIFSLMGALFILGRNFSKFKEISEDGGDVRDRSLEEVAERIKKEEKRFMYLCRRMARRINLKTALEKHKQFSGAVNIKLEKILRKTRIGFLKLDNKFIVLIERLRKRKEDDKPTPSPSQEGNSYPPPIPPKRGISKEKEYLKLIGDDPKNTDAYWKLGILYSRKGNYHDALNCFKEIARIKPGYEKAKEKIKIISGKMKNRN